MVENEIPIVEGSQMFAFLNSIFFWSICEIFVCVQCVHSCNRTLSLICTEIKKKTTNGKWWILLFDFETKNEGHKYTDFDLVLNYSWDYIQRIRQTKCYHKTSGVNKNWNIDVDSKLSHPCTTMF